MPWEALERAWRTPYRGSDFAGSAVPRVHRRSAHDAPEVLSAIDERDRQRSFTAATRLLARCIDEELERALEAAAPSAALAAIGEARGLYRTFEDHLAAADPSTAHTLGRAWLELSSGAGSAGVLGTGARSADRARMDAATETISGYLARNDLVKRFATVPVTRPPGTDLFDQDPLPHLVLDFGPCTQRGRWRISCSGTGAAVRKSVQSSCRELRRYTAGRRSSINRSPKRSTFNA